VSVQRIAIVGSPRAGKSTLAVRLGHSLGMPVTHSDSLISLGWSQASSELAELIEQAPGIFEGVAVVRALRKLLQRHATPPVNRVIVLTKPHMQLSSGQEALRKGCATIWSEIEPELRARGVEVVHGAAE